MGKCDWLSCCFSNWNVKAIKPLAISSYPPQQVHFIAVAHFYNIIIYCIDLAGAMFPLRPVILMCCIFKSKLKMLLLFQADPTKVETVQDVLARAAAKGLLGGLIPEQSKTGKRRKHRKNCVVSATSKPSSPSSQERQTGNEIENGQDPVTLTEHEEGKGECSEDDKEKEKGGKGGKKRRGLRGRKPKVKRRPKQTHRTTTVSRDQLKDHKRKPAKRKANPSHYKRRLTKSRQRRIPRLTLTLISSAKPSSHLSSITALAHQLSENAANKTQQTAVFSNPSLACPAPLTRHAASKPVQRQNIEPERAEKALKGTTKAVSLFKARAKVVMPKTVVVTQDVSKAADFVLPPISFPSHSSPRSRSGSSLSQRLSNSQFVQISASSSSVSLPGL